MISAYHRYCHEGSPDSLREFLELAFNFDFLDYESIRDEMFRIYQKTELIGTQSRSLSSNGSIGRRTSYIFGPNTNDTTYTTENYLRCYKNQSIPRIILYDTFPFYMPQERFFIEERSGVDYVIRCDLNSHRAEDFLLTFLKNLNYSKQYNFYNTLGRWQRIVNLPRIVEFLNEHPNFLLTNADSEAFFKRSIFNRVVNDQMIDWKSGLNFYTCPEGTIHFIPLFVITEHRSYNLLNLADKQGWENSDLFEVSAERRICSCGKPYFPLTFIPHVSHSPIHEGRYLYDISLAERLTSRYNNIHFIQRSHSEMDISYSLMEGEMLDEEVLRATFPLTLTFRPNTVFRIGRGKQLVFWKGDQVIWSTNNPIL